MKIFLILLFILNFAHAAIDAELALYSNFIWRGTTFTENKPALQGTIDYEHAKGYFASTFVSNAEFSDEALGDNAKVTQETDIMLGKRWHGDIWEAQLSYNRFYFPKAGIFDTDEFNFQFQFKNLQIELSYMDDYFGYQGTYKYVRLGYGWVYAKSVFGAFFVGYNSFTKPKGNIKERCLDSTCSEKAYTTTGAGNPDYIDLYWVNKKVFENDMSIEFDVNWTNRYEYNASEDGVSKKDAKDFTILTAIIIPFTI